MKIINGFIFEKSGKFINGCIQTEGKDIKKVVYQDNELKDAISISDTGISDNETKADISEGDENLIDATDMYVIPGLTDIHFHGCMGHDFCEGNEKAIQAMAEYELKQGITTICPATMTYGEDRLKKILIAARNHKNDYGSELVGVNMEGPFISYEKRGAQNSAYIVKPDIDMFRRLKEASGNMIKLIDLAPEKEGALEFIKEVSSEVHVSLAHTTADYETAKCAFEKGADHVTHLYNAMPPFSHREPGVIGAASDYEKSYVEIIGDGIHLAPAVVRATLRLFGDDRVVLISDSMGACGMPDGEYELGGQQVFVKGKTATLSDGTIAGSVTNLMDCVRILVNDMNISLETAVKCAAVNSAKSIGIFEQYGSIEAGKRANLVILDRSLNVRQIIHNGLLLSS